MTDTTLYAPGGVPEASARDGFAVLVLLTSADEAAIRRGLHEQGVVPADGAADALDGGDAWILTEVLIPAGGKPRLRHRPEPVADSDARLTGPAAQPVLLWDWDRLNTVNIRRVVCGAPPLPAGRCYTLKGWASVNGEPASALGDLFALGRACGAGVPPPRDGRCTPRFLARWVLTVIATQMACQRGRRRLIVGTDAGPEPIDDGGAERRRAAAAPKPATAARSVRLLDRIGEGMEGLQDVRARVAPLLTPLPLLGNADPDHVVADLDGAFPWLAPLNQAVGDALRLTLGLGCPWFRGPPLLVVGPPGTGKTSWVHALARRLGVPAATVAAAGLSDNRAVEGTARGWRGAMPCLPALVAADHRCANPIVLVDEIDKAGGSEHTGDIRATLLTLLEPETAARHWDPCLHGHLDLRWVTWILTANRLDLVPAPLVSRCRVVPVGGPGPEHLPMLLEGLRARLARGFEVPPEAVPAFPALERVRLEQGFRRHRCLRRLRVEAEAVLGRLAWMRRRGVGPDA